MTLSEFNQKEIDFKLLCLLRRRYAWMIIPHSVLLLVCYLILKEMNQDVPGSLYPGFVVMGGLLFRLIIMHSFFDQMIRKNIFVTSVFYLGVSITGLGWGLLFSNIYNYYDLISVEGLFGVGVIITLMSGGVTTFTASFVTGIIYVLSTAAIPTYLLFSDSRPSVYILSFVFVGNISYQIYHYYFSNKYLKSSLVSELRAISQKKSLQSVIDAIPGVVAVIDREGVYQMVNNFKGGLFNPDSNMISFINKFLNSDEDFAVLEFQSSDQGAETWHMVNLKKISFPYVGAVVTILPITELVQAKNDLKIHEARSQYASKLASLGELSAGIAHEVNNPLTIIEGAASLIKVILSEDSVDKKALEKSADKVLETSQRIARIIKSLRTLSGNADDEPFKNFSFADVMEPSIEICKARLNEHDIKFTVHPAVNDVALFGNEVQVSQVIMNLVSNGIDAVKDIAGPRRIDVSFSPSIKWLDILVVDSGVGIRPEIRDQIMNPFFTTKDLGQGTGLGLSISKSIMEYHQGSLDYLPNEKNTTFRLRFPRMNLLKIRKNVH